MSLGLSDEIARLFPLWGPALHGTLVSAIVAIPLLQPAADPADLDATLLLTYCYPSETLLLPRCYPLLPRCYPATTLLLTL